MKFTINRVSYYDSSRKPHDRAVKEDDHWVINFKTIKNLTDFCKEVGDLIIEYDYDIPNIRIYDNYID